MHDHPGPLVPLHVGDTWMEPFEGARMQDLRVEEHPGMHRYGPTQGLPALVDAIVEKTRTANQLRCERDSVLVAAGATSALANAVGAIAEPGEEVLILAPFWPLIRGIVQAFRATPVEIPFYDRVHTLDDAVASVRERIGPRSVALYVSTPSNPTGRTLPRAWLEALAELAREHDLWLLADEVYERYVYDGEHFSVGSVAPERTVSV
jgi:N-succinyldiaminopimelate aminotransferase